MLPRRYPAFRCCHRKMRNSLFCVGGHDCETIVQVNLRRRTSSPAIFRRSIVIDFSSAWPAPLPVAVPCTRRSNRWTYIARSAFWDREGGRKGPTSRTPSWAVHLLLRPLFSWRGPIASLHVGERRLGPLPKLPMSPAWRHSEYDCDRSADSCTRPLLFMLASI